MVFGECATEWRWRLEERVVGQGINGRGEDVGSWLKKLQVNCLILHGLQSRCWYRVIRSVHAWDYRRYILSSLPSTFKPARTHQTEIKYTTKKIESNFSNFSAWHQRTKVLSEVWKDLDEVAVKKGKQAGKLLLDTVPEEKDSLYSDLPWQNLSWWLKHYGQIQAINLDGYTIAGLLVMVSLFLVS